MSRIHILLYSLLSLFIFNSCNTSNDKESIEKEVNSKLKKLFDNPSKLDNSLANKRIIENFKDSGAFNNKGQKDGKWVEYRIEHLVKGVPATIISNSGDTSEINITHIIKKVGIYENGKKVGKWNDFILKNKTRPYIWRKKNYTQQGL